LFSIDNQKKSARLEKTKERKGKKMNFTTATLFTARIYDVFGEVIDYTTHSDAAMLENIVRGDWEGSDWAVSFTIFNDKNEEVVSDEIA